jgi:hypothetical protein
LFRHSITGAAANYRFELSPQYENFVSKIKISRINLIMYKKIPAGNLRGL